VTYGGQTEQILQLATEHWEERKKKRARTSAEEENQLTDNISNATAREQGSLQGMWASWLWGESLKDTVKSRPKHRGQDKWS